MGKAYSELRYQDSGFRIVVQNKVIRFSVGLL